MRKIKTGNKQPSTKLVKIGTLASMFDVLPSAINFYTREGLLKEDGRTQGGYRLYNPDKALRTLQKIEDLQNKRRLSVAEIKKLL
ncbi:MerR family transcriptional regulator [bacterium]|jgi:DNA-binding transcriptional MerR regulator|nr:MerR family transcriptional regulator [bacterium]